MRRQNLRAWILPCLAYIVIAVVDAIPAGAREPGTLGPFAVTVQEYDYGDLAFTPTDFPGAVELRAQVFRPTDLAAGPYPLTILVHGRHATCSDWWGWYLIWPCGDGQLPFPSYRGFNYVAQVLASQGYIVVSISANGISAFDNEVFDLGAAARAELIQRHLQQWATFNTTGAAPFGTTFVGRVDLTRVGVMGHSRGGEGAMRHFLYNQSLGSPYGIRAIFALAPTDFNRAVVNHVPFAVLLPYCDGDVSDLQGVHYYDDARYSAAGDLSPKHTLLVMGANHNYFNHLWNYDDWIESEYYEEVCDPQPPGFRLGWPEQEEVGSTYIGGFFRLYVGGETEFAPMLKGDAPSPLEAIVYPSYHAPDSSIERRDVNRVLTSLALTTNSLGGAVTQSGMTPYDVCGATLGHCLAQAGGNQQPHTNPSARSSAPGLLQLRVGWDTVGATYTNELPAGARDISAFQVFQFRVAVNFSDSRAGGSFRVRLIDGTGTFSDASVSDYSDALFFPPGNPDDGDPVPKVVLNTARIPLSAFTGINKSDVRSVEFRFDQSGSGALLITDLAFADTAAPPPPVPDLIESAVSNPPPAAGLGQDFSVTDTVENQGVGGAGVSTSRYYLSLDTGRSVGDVLVTGSRAVPALAVGATSTGTVTVTVPDTAAGAYFLLACADDTGTVPESHEGNNCRASASTVQIGIPDLPDLIESAVSNPPATVGLGQHFSVTDTASNQGGALAPASSTRYYLSLDATKSIKDKLLSGARSVPLLGPGASSTGSRTVTVKSSTAPGTYFLLACVDDKNVVAEDDETNNCRASSTTVVVVAPDLIETSITDPPASRAVGGTFTITDTVYNQGTAAASASTTQYYLSLNRKKSKTDIRFSATRLVQALGIGASSSGSLVVTVPAGTPVATYFVLACADDTKSTPESDEQNNCRASSQQVAITP